MTEPEGDLSVRGNDNVDVTQPTTWDELNNINEYLAGEGRGEYDTVVFDSVTFMAELIGGRQLTKALRAERDPRRVYSQIGASLNHLIYDSIRLPMNVIYIVQMKSEGGEEAVDLNPEAGQYPLTLQVTPMVYKVLAPAVSFIGRTYKTRGFDEAGRPAVEYWVSFEDYGKSPAGSRIPVPDQVRDLSLDALLDQAQKGA